MVEYIDERYDALSEADAAVTTTTVAATGVGAGRVLQYRDFDNMKPPTFNRVQNLIIAMR